MLLNVGSGGGAAAAAPTGGAGGGATADAPADEEKKPEKEEEKEESDEDMGFGLFDWGRHHALSLVVEGSPVVSYDYNDAYVAWQMILLMVSDTQVPQVLSHSDTAYGETISSLQNDRKGGKVFGSFVMGRRELGVMHCWSRWMRTLKDMQRSIRQRYMIIRA